MRTTQLHPAINQACLWFADAVVHRKGVQSEWFKGHQHARFSTSLMIIQSGMTKRNRRAIGKCIAEKLSFWRQA